MLTADRILTNSQQPNCHSFSSYSSYCTVATSLATVDDSSCQTEIDGKRCMLENILGRVRELSVC